MGVKKHIQHVKSSVEGKAPSEGDLLYGELAINYNAGNEQLFIKNSGNEIVGLRGITTIEAVGDKGKEQDDKVLTLTATASDDGKTVTIEGSADTYNTATIDQKLAEIAGGGEIDLSGYLKKTEAEETYQPIGTYITNVNASGTSPLTLSATTSSSNAVTLTGSVDLSDYATTSDLTSKQDKLQYYSEVATTSITEASIIVDLTSVDINESSVTIAAPTQILLKDNTGDNNSLLINGDTAVRLTGSTVDIQLNTNNDHKATYNGDEIATVSDIPDVSTKQDKLQYYSEQSGNVNITPISHLTLEPSGTIYMNPETDIEINVPNGKISVDAKEGVLVNTNGTFEYNGEEVATVTDIPDVSSKQDKLMYYSEGSNTATIDSSRIRLNSSGDIDIAASEGGVISINSVDSNIDIYAKQAITIDADCFEILLNEDSKNSFGLNSTSGIYASSTKGINMYEFGDGINVNSNSGINLYTNTSNNAKAYYNNNEIAVVDSTLEAYRTKYASTLLTNVRNCFDSSSSGMIVNAKIVEVDEEMNACRIRISHQETYHETYGSYITWGSLLVAVSSYTSNYNGTGYSAFDLLFSIYNGSIVFPSSIYTLNRITSY